MAVTSPSSFRVSVIIPVFNAEAFIRRAVASALMQPEVGDVVLVEDGSADGSLPICRQWAARHSDRVRLFRHAGGQNRGAGPSRNLGIQRAASPYIAFLDADDYYLPGRFARDAALLENDPSIDGVYNALGTDVQDEAGRTWWTTGKPRPEITTMTTPPLPERLFFEMNPIGHAGYFSLDTLTVRRTVFDKVEWFSDLRLSQDTLLILQLAALCRLAGGETIRPVAMRGVHAHNRIQDRDKMQEAKCVVSRELLAWAARRRLPRAHRRAILRFALSNCRDGKALRALSRLDPWIIASPGFARTGWQIFQARLAPWRRMLFRQSPEDPFLPGLFPPRRRAMRTRKR